MCVRQVTRGGVAAWLLVGLVTFGCGGPTPGSETFWSTSQALSTFEGFEAGSKVGYANGDVTLASGVWTFDDALVGATTGDAKDGAKAARLRNAGSITMEFDYAGGADAVTVRHATFGSDAAGTWALFYSQDQGASWTQAGNSVTSSSPTLATATIAVGVSGPVRLSIRKTDGGSNRIDVDDLAIADFTGGGGAPAPPPPVRPPPTLPGASVSVHTTLGLPAPAATTDATHYLSVKADYVLSYDSARKIPNWVSWELNSSYLGSTDRANDFRPDDTLPSTMPQASLADYVKSGYQRGHMCPSADRTASVAANEETFFLTNMVPQAANSNTGPWEKLERYARDLASSNKELFVVAGGVLGSTVATIGDGVAVPESTFKVIAVLDAPGEGPGNVTASTRVIGVVMPNDDAKIAQTDDWKKYRVSVRSIEALTGFDFLSDVDPSVQDAIETRVDNE
jgi:endonuclease G